MALAPIETARAKVNLALHVLGRRPDGYHELDSIVAFADFGDELTFERAGRFEIVASGPFAGALPSLEDNIVTAAWRALAELAGGLPPVRVHLQKNLPVAAGIGGGSANAAATIRGLTRLFDLDLPDIASAARGLGADVPVCLAQVACRMQGAGETIVALPWPKPIPAVLVNPLIAVSTAAVFRALGLAPLDRHRAPIDIADPESWRNDLMPAALKVAPQIAEVLDAIGRFASPRMSGSGATCFGVFEDETSAAAAARAIGRDHPQWWVRQVKLG